jgi:sorbose reductase
MLGRLAHRNITRSGVFGRVCQGYNFQSAAKLHNSAVKMAPGAVEVQQNGQTDRSELANRLIPHMLLSDGTAKSKTAAPITSHHAEPTKNALKRFTVSGNAVVTGGTGTLGLAACHALLEHGLSGLAIFDINAGAAEKQSQSLKDRFPDRKISIFQVDVTDDEAVNIAVAQANETVGPINHLFCFSGIVGCVHALSMTSAQWKRVLDVNTTGAFFCAQAVARKMVEQELQGSITFTASISAHRVNYPQPQAAYNVSKAALLSLKNCLAAEWARYGIRTNTISPGYMDTILNEGDGLASTRKVWEERNPSGRMGVPSELTGAVVLLASQAGTYINGSDILVDGGQIVF